MLKETVSFMPFPLQLVGLFISCFVLRRALRIAGSRSEKFVIWAIWLRLIISAFHIITFKGIGPVTITALASLGITCMGLLLSRKALLFSIVSIPIYPMLGAILLSACVNNLLLPAIDPVVKFAYFIVLSMHMFEVIRTGSLSSLSKSLPLAFSPLLIFQAISVVFNYPKTGENDGSASYIGGFYHEGGFSSGVLTILLLMTVAISEPRMRRAIWGLVALVGLGLANYRTTIAAALPAAFYLFSSLLSFMFPQKVRSLTWIIVGLFMAVGLFGIIGASGRFAEVDPIGIYQKIMGPPSALSSADMDLLSGRVYIWSAYLDMWRHADPLTKLVGFGTDAWQQYFIIYAHNNFVHYLFEYGILGECALVIMYVVMIVLGQLGRRELRMPLLFAQLSFITVNLATMPLWTIEGLIAFSVVWAWTTASFALRRHEEIWQPPLHIEFSDPSKPSTLHSRPPLKAYS